MLGMFSVNSLLDFFELVILITTRSLKFFVKLFSNLMSTILVIMKLAEGVGDAKMLNLQDLLALPMEKSSHIYVGFEDKILAQP
jgi:hypothetical protein